MDTGESSGTKIDETLWAKLVSSHSRYPDIEIKSNEMTVCSEIMSTSVEKHSWCKIMRGEDLISATIQNLSSNTISVDKAVLNKEECMAIKCGNEIITGPDREGYLIYTFKLLPIQEQCKNHVEISLDIEITKCSICLNVWHDVVTVSPCLHNFCNGCFSEWLRRSQKEQKRVLCPHCRAVVHSVGRNHLLHNIEEVILQTLSSLRRSNEELALLDRYASIKSNLVIMTGKSLPCKRPIPSSSDENYGAERLCPQCGTGIGGFRCTRTTPHLLCQACGGMMPSRPDSGIPQHCLGCNRVFCAAYWRAQGVSASDIATVCSRETFSPISEHTISRLPDSTHQNNRYEKDITERCIQQTGKTLQDVVSDWMVKLNNREIDRARMPLYHGEMITAGTHLCHIFDPGTFVLGFDPLTNTPASYMLDVYGLGLFLQVTTITSDCYEKLVAFLLYWFRISMPKYLLPLEASKREDCWYGYDCRTQHHSDEHAQKRNHVCRPTRGTNRT